MDSLLDTSNSRSSHIIINDSKAYLKDNPTKEVAQVAGMFNLEDSTLRTSIASDKKPTSQGSGGHNKILKHHQVDCIMGKEKKVKKKKVSLFWIQHGILLYRRIFSQLVTNVTTSQRMRMRMRDLLATTTSF